MLTREEMIAVFLGGNIPKSSEWIAFVNKLYDTAEGSQSVEGNLQQSEAIAREIREHCQTVSEDAMGVAQAKADIEQVGQAVGLLVQRAESAERASQSAVVDARKQAEAASQSASEAKSVLASVDEKISVLVAEGDSQVNRISSEAQLLIKQLVKVSEEQYGLLSEPLKLAEQHAAAANEHSKDSASALAGAKQASTAAQQAFEKTAQAKDETVAAQKISESASDKAVNLLGQVSGQIIPVHTDVIRTQQIIRSLANGVIEDAASAEVAAKQAAGFSQSALASSASARESLSQIGPLADQVAQDKSQAASASASAQQALSAVVEQREAAQQAAEITNENREEMDALAKVVSDHANNVASVAGGVARDAESASFSADAAQQALHQVVDHMFSYTTNLIRTQAVIINNHSFK